MFEEPIADLLCKDTVIPEIKLRQLSRRLGSLTAIGHCQEDSDSKVKQCQDVIAGLFRTAEDGAISAGHRAAAYNALCGLLESCATSRNRNMQRLAVQDDASLRMLNLYLERYDSSRAKAMRQILSTISRLMLCKSANHEDCEAKALSTVFFIAFGGGDHAKVKPALLVLTCMLSKDIVAASSLLYQFQQWHQRHSPSVSNAMYVSSKAATEFLIKTMDFIPHQDLAPTAGHLIAMLCSKAAHQGLSHSGHGEEKSLGSIWVPPLAHSARKHLTAIENFKNYVFPPLFKLNINELGQFLDYLQTHRDTAPALGLSAESSLTHKDLENIEFENIIYFSALQVGKDLGLVQLIDTQESATTIIHPSAICIPDTRFGRLLAHSSPELRLAGLSLLISSASITTPFTRGSLSYLQHGLSHFHADTDARFRSEVLGLIQQMMDRLRGAMANLGKHCTWRQKLDPNIRSGADISNTQPGIVHGDSSQLFAAHMRFLTWYLDFLKIELRSTAPYQRLITASKALTILIRSGLDVSIPYDALSKRAQGDIKWPFHRSIVDSSLIRILLDLLLNPFDDIRQVAASILNIGLAVREPPESEAESSKTVFEKRDTSSPLQRTTVADCLIPYLRRAWPIMLRSGRADHADGVARLFQLLFAQHGQTNVRSAYQSSPSGPWWTSRLGVVDYLTRSVEDTVVIARQDLVMAVQQHPMHGVLAGLRYIIDDPDFYGALLKEDDYVWKAWQGLHQRLYDCFTLIWESVRNVLCNDAPEGHMPEEFDDEVMLTTKDVLSYSWRALKEASLLLRAIMRRATYKPKSDEAFLNVEQIEKLGDLCFLQLSELRHRGAFSTVAQSFAACCTRCITIKDDQLRCFVVAWYQQLLDCIETKASIFTRRSAGIPALMTGILSAEPGGPLYHRAMVDLLRIAKADAWVEDMQGTYLPQVHAMNCLRAIFTTTTLGEVSESYIAAGLRLAASRLSSDVWAIRNCGLMLFRALIDRLLGTNSSQNESEVDPGKTSRLSYGRYPELLDLIIQLLQAGQPKAESQLPATAAPSARSSSETTEAFFPALEILRRAPPPSSHRRIILSLLLSLTGSPQWHVRDLVARTYAALIDPDACAEELVSLIRLPWQSQNALHGQLMCARHTLQKLVRVSGNVISDGPALLNVICQQYQQLYTENPCPFTKAAFLDVLNIALVHWLRSLGEERDPIELEVHRIMSDLSDRFIAHEDISPNDLQYSSQQQAMKSVLRRSGAICLALSHLGPFSEHTGYNSVLCNSQLLFGRLAAIDPDAGLEVFRAVETACSSSNSKVLTARFRILCEQILAAVDEDGFRSLALEALVRIPSGQSPRGLCRYDSDHIMNFQTKAISQLLVKSSISPFRVERNLQMWGASLCARRCSRSNWDSVLSQEVAEWIRMLRAAGQDGNDFGTRYAGIVSMERFGCAWLAKPRLQDPLLVGVCLALYDTLNDDDDEIRDVAAMIASKILAPSNSARGEVDGAVPLVASQRLSEALARGCSDSPYSCQAAISRLLGVTVSKKLPPPSVQTLLEQARKEDNSLFVQEKQNLFIDEVREAVIWSRVLKQLSPKALRAQLTLSFQTWVIEGIAVLTETAKNERDGPLGWTSKPEVFALGMRVIYGADVLLDWASRTQKVTVTGTEILRALRHFADVGDESEVHCLWLDRVEKILADAVVRRLGLLWEGTGRILSDLRIK